jgi:hypothetical protein
VSFASLSIPERDVTEELRGSMTFAFPTTGAAMRALGVRLLRGRLLDDNDVAGSAPVVVLGESLARRLWPDEEALGKRVRVGADSMPYSEVVGVVRDLTTYRITTPGESQFFVPPEQIGWEAHELLVKVEGDASIAAARVRAALTGWRKDFSSLTVLPVRSQLDNQFRPWRLGASVFAGFALITLLLAAIGVFGIVSFTVTRRVGELGIRAALGATKGRLARHVLSETVMLAAAGMALGTVIALAGARWLSAMLFQTSPRDGVSMAAASLILLLVAVLAALGPMRRATRVDPASALRIEV